MKTAFLFLALVLGAAAVMSFTTMQPQPAHACTNNC